MIPMKINKTYPLIYWFAVKILVCAAVFYAASEAIGYPDWIALIGSVFLYITAFLLAVNIVERFFFHITKPQKDEDKGN